MTTTHTHTPRYSTSEGTYYCTDCFETITADEALAINPDLP